MKKTNVNAQSLYTTTLSKAIIKSIFILMYIKYIHKNTIIVILNINVYI